MLTLTDIDWEAFKEREERLVDICKWFTCFDQYAEPYLDFSFYPTYDAIRRSLRPGKSIHDETWYGWRITVDLYEGVAWWNYVGSFPDLGQEPVSEKEIEGWRSIIDASLLPFCKVLEAVTGIPVMAEEILGDD